ncbi:hypothetical protein BH23CHL5_BH23CHL5_22900 [soil metagenome]
MQNVVRGVMALVLTAFATWLADRIVRKIFGPDADSA